MTGPSLRAALRPADLDTCAQWAWLTGRVGEAIDLYLDLARVYKSFPHVHFKLGYLFLAVDDYHNAVRHFSAEIDQRSASDETNSKQSGGAGSKPSVGSHSPRIFLLCAHLGRREAHLALGEAEAAESDRLFVANRGGGTHATLIAMGTLFCDLGMLQRAEVSFDQCADLDAGDPDYLIAHADLYLAQKRYVKAESMFEKCRAVCHASSALFHRALIGQGTAFLRNRKLQDAAVLLLQAMNSLRALVRDRASGAKDLDATVGQSQSSSPTNRSEDAQVMLLYHQATNMYGGVCLLLGNLKAALDTFASATRDNGQNAALSLISFSLPVICVLPGTKDARGDVVDSSKLTVANLTELVRHLDEVEWRYGPDPCLYFHRANAHRALGELTKFAHDLALVEMMETDFMKMYLSRDCFGDFLDVETVSWLPLRVVESINQSLEKGEYKSPVTPTGLIGRPYSVIGALGRSTPKGKKKALQRPIAVFSESAIFEYFQQRVDHRMGLDEYAQVYQLDGLRRLPLSRAPQARPGRGSSDHLSEWEGADLDKLQCKPMTKQGEIADRVAWCREKVKAALVKHGQHPFVHMAAGMIELELCNASIAQLYFTEALEKIERRQHALTNSGGSPRSGTLASNWQQEVAMRMKYYCLVWRSMASRLRVEMEHAVEDLNVAAAVKLSAKALGATDPLLVSQRSLIMLFNGHLKSAHKLLRQLERRVRCVLRKQLIQRRGNADGLGDLIAVSVVDMLSNAGLNTFHLLPAAVEREFLRLPSSHAFIIQPVASSPLTMQSEESEQSSDEEQDEDVDAGGVRSIRATKAEEEKAVAIVKSALGKRAGASGASGSTVLQTETLDKFFESGLKKLALTGRLEQAIPFFLAALLVDENYLSPTNFASLELFKCKENEFVEEKLYNCFVQLGKRSRWLNGTLGWRFEAMVDANLAHAYLPSDLDTLWHRAKLFQESRNYVSAVNDLSGCMDVLNAHMMWKRSAKKHGKMTAVFPNETKRTQWLQLLLERGQLEMATSQWEDAISDFTMLVEQAGKNNPALHISGLESRSISLINLRRYANAIHDLQQQRALMKKKNGDTERANGVAGPNTQESDLLTLILIGNLYCQLALDQIKLNSGFSQRVTPGISPLVAEQLKALHRNSGFLQRATEFYLEAQALAPSHFLVHFSLGRMFAISRQSRLAIDSLTECLRHQPLFLPAIFLRGCVYAQEKLIYLGLADLYRVRHRAPSYPNLHTTIGYCHFERGDMTKAVKSLTEALHVDPGDADALYLRGCALQELFILNNAEKDFSQALRVRGDHPRALYQRSVCATLRLQYATAIADLEALSRLEPEWADVWALHAYTCFCLKRYDSAVLSYSHAIGFYDDPNGGRSGRSHHAAGSDISLLYMYRAFAQLQSGKVQSAMEDLELAVKRDNGNAIAFLAKAYLLMQTDERANVAQVLAHALQHAKKLSLLPASELRLASKAARPTSVTGTNGFFVTPDSSSDPHVGFVSSPPRLSVAMMRMDGGALSEPSKPPIRGPSPSVIFRRRKDDRDNELTQHLVGVHVPPSRPAGAHRDHPPLPFRQGKHKLIHGGTGATTTPTVTVEGHSADPDSETMSRRSTRSKIVRVIKRMMFEHRVLKALKAAANSKQLKNQQSIRALAEVLQPVSVVAWPKGTQTTNALVWAYNTIGIYQFGERKVDDALMAFTLAMQADAATAMTCFNRGNVYLHMGVLHSSVSGFQDAIEIDECCSQAYNNLGVAYYHMDRLEEAQEAFAAGLLRADGSNQKAVLLYNLGVICQVQGKPDEAVDLYQQAIRLDGSRVEFFNNRSSILHQQMKFTVALEDYNRALLLPARPENSHELRDGSDSQPNSIEALLNRAQLFISMGGCANAIRDLKLALKALVHLRTSKELVAAGGGNNSLEALASCGSSRSTSRARFGPEDEQLVSRLLVFCDQWRRALQIAVNDFLFVLESFPFLAKYQLHAVAEAVQDEGESSPEDDNRAAPGSVFALPIEDATFFNYNVDLRAWIERCAFSFTSTAESPEGEQGNADEHERNNGMSGGEVFIDELFCSPLAGDLKQACKECAAGDLDAAARFLLRAHYKTCIDSHEEYAIMLWRMQVELMAGQEDSSATLAAVVRQLREFLAERQTPDEEAFVSAYGTGIASKTARAYSSRFDDYGELSTPRDLVWVKQKRVVRADAFTFLGGLYQLNGQESEARAAFAHALHLRNDHVLALVNFLQLCILSSDHEASLSSIVKLMEIIASPEHVSGNTNARSGLLNADRSVSAMLAPAFEAFAKSEDLTSKANQLLQTVKEYRGLVTTHVESNRSQIFRKQGVVAHQVHEIREAFSVAAAAAARSASQANGALEVTFALQLETLDALVDEYTARIVALPNAFTAEQSYETFNVAFEDEFARICEQILESLPEDDRIPLASPASPSTSLMDNSPPDGKVEMIDAAASVSPRTSSRRATVSRPSTTSLRARLHTRQHAGVKLAHESPHEVSILGDGEEKTTVQRPQRPLSGPSTAQRRQTQF